MSGRGYKPENRFSVGIVYRKEGLGAALIMALACITLKKIVEIGIAAVEGFAIVMFTDRLFMPSRHIDFGNAPAAASSLSFG